MALENRCDVHTHTVFSYHAYSTVEENVRAAHDRGLEILGIADHFSPLVSVSGDFREYQHFVNQNCWPRQWMGVTLLRGAEVDIVDLEGTFFGAAKDKTSGFFGEGRAPFSLLEECTRDCDYLVASVHEKGFAAGATPEQLAAMYGAAACHPKVLILGHIGRTGLPFDIDSLLDVVAAQHKLVEINEHSFDLSAGANPVMEARCEANVRACAERDISIAVNTDAHISFDVGRVPRAMALLKRVGFPERLVATRSAEAFLEAAAPVFSL